MKLYKHEKIIKGKMQSFHPVLDKNALWITLSQSIPDAASRKRKRRRIFFLVLLLIIPGLISIYFLSNKKSGSNAQLKDVKPFLHQKNQAVKNKKEFAKSNVSTTAKSESGNNNFKTGATTEKGIGTNGNLHKNINSDKIKNSSFILYHTGFKSNESNANPVRFFANESEELYKNQDNERLKVTVETQNEDFSNRLTVMKIPPLHKKIYTIQYFSKSVILSNTNDAKFLTNNNSILHFDKIRHSRYLAWNVAAGIGGFDHIYLPKNAESTTFTGYFDSKTKPSWQIEIGLSYYIFKGIYLNTGLQFTQLVTRLHPKWERLLNEQNPYYNGLTQRVMRQSEYEAIGHNYQNVFDLPLKLGIIALVVERLNLSMEAGYLFNVYTYSKGVIVDEQYKLHYYDNNDNNPYGSFPGAWEYSAIIGYDYNDNFNIYLKSAISKRKIEYKFSTFDIEEKYNIYNIKLGLKYKFIK